MTVEQSAIDWEAYEAARVRFGADFVRVLGYLREDGEQAVVTIETAMRAGDPAALVRPAGTLKDAAYDVGAEALGEVAERIESLGLHCVQRQQEPDEALPMVAGLAALFQTTMAALESSSSPLQRKRSGRSA